MWLSCSSFFQQFFHLYCPVRFGRKADPNGDYIRRYLPVLKNFPTKYIHEPWTASEKVQIAAKCVIGKDYPMPMVNHQEVSHINLERMKQVYQQLSHYRGANMYNSSYNQINQRESDDGYPKSAKRRAVEYPDESNEVQKRDISLK
ncbi:cryptochrome-1 [Trichonephila clavipes]|nr:cryptochrome-1 [Trichonephila clavipes]